jgi:hypothetical protein
MNVGELLLFRMSIRCLDGIRVQIKSIEFRVRERLRHDQGGAAMTASDVGHASSGAQLLLDAIQRGDPFLVDVSLVTGSKEPLGPAEKARVMLSPRKALSGPETLGYQRLTLGAHRWTVGSRR